MASENDWNWEIQLLPSPDAELIRTEAVVASSDSVVLDGCKRWVNLSRGIIERKLPKTHIVDLSVQ
jgi:hypothetical protein